MKKRAKNTCSAKQCRCLSFKAEAIVQPKSNLAVIKRANSETENIDLKDPKSDDVLIFPGNIVEFKTSELSPGDTAVPQFYFIGGNIVSAGQKDFHTGLTLTQSILASGGLKKASVIKVVIRRKKFKRFTCLPSNLT